MTTKIDDQELDSSSVLWPPITQDDYCKAIKIILDVSNMSGTSGA